MMMNILGIGLSHSCGVCLIQKDQIVFAQDEDRFSRLRRQKGWPEQTLAHVLERFKLREEDINLCVLCDIQSAERINKTIKAAKVITVHHHLAHVMSGWALTDYSDFDAISIDGGGDLGSWQSYAVVRDRKVVEWESNCGYRLGRDGKVHKPWWFLKKPDRPFGTYWSLPCVVNFGMVDNHGVGGYEGKLMGLAAYGHAEAFDPAKAQYDARFTIERNRGWHWLRTHGHPKIGDNDFCEAPEGKISLQEVRRLRKEEGKVVCEYNLNRHEDREFAANFGAYLQHLTQEAICELFAKNFKSETPVVASGGLFSNVIVNGRLNRDYDLFITPCMGDDGLALGAAAWGAYISGIQRLYSKGLYLGYDAGNNHNIDCEEVAQYLIDDQVVGVIEGRMELGPRALGARTILADPRDSNTNWTINERLGRVEYMPFAPVLMREHAESIIEGWSPFHRSSKHMTLTYQVKPEWKERIKGVVHVDGSVRPQVLEESDNPIYYRILEAYYRKTGIPVLINTSFNRHGEPMLRTVDHGIKALKEGRVDVLVAGGHIHTASKKHDIAV